MALLSCNGLSISLMSLCWGSWERGAHNLLKSRPISRFNNLAYGWEVDININFQRRLDCNTARALIEFLHHQKSSFLRIPKSRVPGLLEIVRKVLVHRS
ncbi:hypothetical protein AVEN_242095-1 [Araneus ventricosus]|uniref:SOCS box domain-containing protein n=1 Tax=Araneus ventricosus TaxID=182803 RepID=A0A4Y2SL75_ARAVE|nr:hypothetical protein AVEN_242095-1 [Araneus ventricosus]